MEPVCENPNNMKKTLSILVLGLVAVGSLFGCAKGGSGSVAEKAAPPVDVWKAGKPLPGGVGAQLDDYSPLGLKTKSFVLYGQTYSVVDFLSQNLTMTFDAAAQTFNGKSVIEFKSSTAGRPVFLLNGEVTALQLDGVAAVVSKVQDPDGMNAYFAVESEIADAQTHRIELTYTLPADRMSFQNGGVGILTDMTDLSQIFFENWGPANLEEDRFTLTLRLQVLNATGHAHQVFNNGRLTENAPNDFTIEFPSHYTSSSFYVHLTNRDFETRRFTVTGTEKSIPVVVYSAEADLADEAARQIPDLFRELEGDYGPYAHSGFVAYIHPTGGGMEYVGATITSIPALDHELFHSWFARGVMPADGRSGWIDEAMASWRDFDYYRSPSLLMRERTNLAGYSPLQRATPRNCYRDGRALLAEFDLLLKDRGGFKPVMREWFANYRLNRITTEEFWAFLEARTGLDLTDYFKRYVFGGHTPIGPVIDFGHAGEPAPRSFAEDLQLSAPSGDRMDQIDSKHPTPLTREEVLRLR